MGPQLKCRTAAVLALAAALLGGCAGGADRPSEPAETAAPEATGTVALSAAARARFGEGVAALRAGNPQLAAQVFQELAQAHPDLAAAHANYGLAAMQTGDHEAARQAMARAVALRPGRADWQNRLGVLCRRLGDFDCAESAYRAALAADDSYRPAHLNLGILYDVYLQRPAQALSHYQRYQALSAQPDDEVTVWIADLERRL